MFGYRGPGPREDLKNYGSKASQIERFSSGHEEIAQALLAATPEELNHPPSLPRWAEMYPRQPFVIDSMDQARRMFDGYDTGVLYADRCVGEIVDTLERLGVRDDTQRAGRRRYRRSS